uniref:Uncharacterized protein n=1 Tax=Knipowitschia caucasica TaxID=637954 RepID=A0AAV2KAU1_KNICA
MRCHWRARVTWARDVITVQQPQVGLPTVVAFFPLLFSLLLLFTLLRLVERAELRVVCRLSLSIALGLVRSVQRLLLLSACARLRAAGLSEARGLAASLLGVFRLKE